jgi:hypothetical protein
VDHHPGVLRVLGRAHFDGELEVVGELASGSQRFAGVRLRRLSFAQEVGDRRELVGELVQALDGFESPLVGADLPEGLLRFVGPRPEVRRRRFLLQLFERAPRGVAIKDSPGAQRGVPRRR